MKLKKIGIKLVLGILPAVVVAMFALTAISVRQGKAIISGQIQEWVEAELNAQQAVITNELNNASNGLKNLSKTVSEKYMALTVSDLEMTLQQAVSENAAIYGAGVWFEPKAYQKDQEYCGIYAHRKGNGVAVSYERNTQEYDYFNQEYYTIGKTVKEPTYLKPYLDRESGKMLVTGVTSIYNPIGNLIGCATVEIEVASLQNIIGEVRVGDTGDVMLLHQENGVYLGSSQPEKANSGMTILEEANGSFVAAGQAILGNESGVTYYKDGAEKYTVYYETIPEIGWKVVARVPQSELDAPIWQLIWQLLIVCVVAIVVATAAILIQVRSITRGIRKVHKFAGTLAEGDFSIEPMSIRRVDELGQMGRSLNVMYESNRKVIEDISKYAVDITDSGEKVNSAADELKKQFETIVALMNSVNEAMMSAGAATEEVNASTEEVSSSVNILSGEADKSKVMTEEIKSRAHAIEKTSKEAYDYAIKLSREYEYNLSKSLKNAEVVESIGRMAEVISGIAKQINLLSLNASIEAARAGEQGRGFAVVATEIGKMAGDTAEVVDEIQNTIEEVKGAFDMLTADSKVLLAFLKDTVTPDYDRFVGVAKQYGEDAVAIEDNSAKISEMAFSIEGIMSEVANAVQNIAESTQDTADNSAQIMNTIDEVSKVVKEVSEKAKEQEAIAGRLNGVVGEFKLN